ncbi:hypothetical protein CCAND95_160039 [Capnocytophaga canis]|uniref:Uncharacterized protein n=1 Tax=Capnocytophaga canis TaxID=1848903 RepID=A0A0B7HY97_9FLAO|nr:hypothetical protein CCAND95_160039 [Capnocytophaga canis]CEN47407.1 hypothetical protein CCAND38_430038 [Capnocytophaga canis]CEN52283.1 hypothetical protein CCAND93_230003 [Capnocytophaga canis]
MLLQVKIKGNILFLNRMFNQFYSKAILCLQIYEKKQCCQMKNSIFS